MATSHLIYKDEIANYLIDTFPEDATILDIGAGEGTYYNYLKDHFKNIDAVEIFKPNIEKYKLEEKYRNVYNIDIKNFEYDNYDVIIFGDVLEHLEVEEAQKVLEYANDRCKELIVAVPYLNKQGIEEDNIYEIHKQDDLTDEIMKERYPYLVNVFKTIFYGYYIKESNYEEFCSKIIDRL